MNITTQYSDFASHYFHHFEKYYRYKEYFGWIHGYLKLSADMVSVNIFWAVVATAVNLLLLKEVCLQSFPCTKP